MITKKQKFTNSLEGPKGYAKHLRKLHACKRETENEIRALIFESYKTDETEENLYRRSMDPYLFYIDYDDKTLCEKSPFGIHCYFSAHPHDCRWCSERFDHL